MTKTKLGKTIQTAERDTSTQKMKERYGKGEQIESNS